jgi:predicted Ser/Thr protein kinase
MDFLPSAIARYRVIRLIGQGGMGAVYEAEQDQPRRTVALKIIKPGMASPELVRRFEQETQALGRLQHPGIAQIYEAGTADTGFGPQPYFAMEFIRGRSLLKYASEHRLRPHARLELIAKVYDAVHHAHQRGLIHRDLKPGNTLVDESGQPKIVDFGVARLTDSDTHAASQTNAGQLIGTLAYMSPEQVLADPLEIDTRSDVYALGVMLYELLAGRLPYNTGNKLCEALSAIREEDPVRLSSVNHGYRGDIETIVAKALEKDKARRYESAAELAADIRRYLSDDPIAARPPSAAYQLRKFTRRHKALVAGAATVLAVLIAGLAISTAEAARAIRAEANALYERDQATAARQAATSERDRALSAEQIANAERNRAVAAEGQALEQRNRALQAEQAASAERNRAVLEKQRADEESATATAVSDFLQYDLLAQVRPDVQARPNTNPDPDLKVRTALDRAAVRIAGRFQNNPFIEAAIEHTIGSAYKEIGLYAEAQRHLKAALEILTRFRGEEDPATLSTMSDLAHNMFRYQARYADAEPLMEKVFQIRSRLLGVSNPETLNAMKELGDLYRFEGKNGQAERLLSDALSGFRRRLGENHSETIDAKNNLALVYRREGRNTEAEALLSNAFDQSRRVNGEEHTNTLIIGENLAELWASQHMYATAEPLLTKILDVRLRVLGEEHSETWVTMRSLASLYRAKGEPARAEPLVLKVLSVQQHLLGDEDSKTIATLRLLADIYIEERKMDQAEALLVRVLDLGPRDLPGAFARLGELRLERHEYAQAEEPLRLAVAGTEERTGGPPWGQYYFQSLLGESLIGQGKYSLAEPLVVSAYEGWSVLGPPPTTAGFEQAGQRIIKLYEAWGNLEKAAEWRKRLEANTRQ